MKSLLLFALYSRAIANPVLVKRQDLPISDYKALPSVSATGAPAFAATATTSLYDGELLLTSPKLQLI
jgi:hypothetical protein